MIESAESVRLGEPVAGSPTSRLPTLALVPIAAIVWWVAGFLPWILNGLGSRTIGDSDLNISLLAVPLFASNVSTLLLGAGVGGLAAGLVGLLGRGSRGARAAAVVAGVALAVVTVLVQSRSALERSNVDSFSVDGQVMNGLTLVIVSATVLGLALGLAASWGDVGLALALAALAGAAPVWISSVLYVLGVVAEGPGAYVQSGELARWTGAIVLSAALVVLGLRPAARVVLWPVAIVLAWVIGPSVTAAAYIEVLLRPGSGLPDQLGSHVSAALDVWQMAISLDARPLAPWIVAIIAAGAIAWARGRGRVVDPVPAEQPTD